MIRVPAFFKLCKCESHGSVVLENGEFSREFCSREGARAVVFDLLLTHQIDTHEARHLREAVGSLRLPEWEDEASFWGRLVCGVANSVPVEAEEPPTPSKQIVH